KAAAAPTAGDRAGLFRRVIAIGDGGAAGTGGGDCQDGGGHSTEADSGRFGRGGVRMTHAELRDHYELYALGVFEDPGRSEIREHLQRGCEDCMTEVKRAREMMAVLGGAVEPVDPPARLRKRILASVGVE